MHLSLRPEDRVAQTIPNALVGSDDLLLKITVPKRTGRKRKRGSDGPWIQDDKHQDAALSSDASTVLRSMRDNPAKYAVAPVGKIRGAHRFRGKSRLKGVRTYHMLRFSGLPDFQYSATGSSLAGSLRDHFLPLKCM